MKRTSIIKIAILAYVLLGVGLFFCTKACLDAKDNRLKREAISNLTEYFSRQDKFVSVGYSGKKVAYEQIAVPKYEEKAFSLRPNEDKAEWTETWGDVYKLYKLKPKYTSDKSWDSDRQWSGWLLNVVEKVSYDCFRTYQVYPYRVGYRKQDYSWAYSYRPTIQDAIDEAFEFHTSNEKSNYVKYMTRGEDIDSYDVERAVENEYYYCFSYDELVKWRGKHEADSVMIWTNWRKYGDDGSYYKAEDQYEGDYGYMYNGYYKVFNYIAPVAYYQIKYRFNWDPKADDMRSSLIWGYSILTLLLLGCVIPLSVIESRKKKEKEEPLKDRLLRLCNPSQFMKPYDEQKVSVANDLYEKLTNTSSEDIERLKSIRKEASQKLGICFIDQELLKDLLDQANPEKYTKPYIAEKVRVANQLYTRLRNEGIDIDEVEAIQKEINEKLIGNQNNNQSAEEDNIDNNSNDNRVDA